MKLHQKFALGAAAFLLVVAAAGLKPAIHRFSQPAPQPIALITPASPEPQAAASQPNLVQPQTAQSQVAQSQVAQSQVAQPQVAQSNASTKTGSFQSGEHPTQGTVRLVADAGQTWIELGEDFVTSELGPDLVVILHRAPDVLGTTQPPAYPIQTGDYVVVAPLQSFRGAQRYAVPESVNLAEYRSAGIWCRQFNALFGAATLES